MAGLIFTFGCRPSATAPALAQVTAPSSSSCQECHPAEYEKWQSSHHALAERPMDPAKDNAAFVPEHIFKAGSLTNAARFAQGQYQILTAGDSQQVSPHRVQRVVGVEPVRQYLTASTNGRWQVQEDSYAPQTNQWFDVFGTEDRQPGEWGHWTGRGMNWNSTCAECHNTRLQKNYDETSDSYHTSMDEMGLGCAACHANLAAHTAWQASHRHGAEKDPTMTRPEPNQILEGCGSCHSRREDLTGDFSPGHSFFDQYQMQILDDSDSWYADGQVTGEDYEFASFLSSRMSQRGVICLDCHDAHSGRTILPGNNLCLRCHSGGFSNAPVIQPLQHSHHGLASAGNLCVSCHMPITTYMQRHGRHDHGFTIPDPLLTEELGVPNACNRCHQDRTASWAADFTKAWYGNKMERPTRERARWIAAGQKGAEGAETNLVKMLSPERESFYWRAVAAGLLSHWAGDPAVKNGLFMAAKDTHPLVREKAVQSLEQIIDQNDPAVDSTVRQAWQDPYRNVRLAAAWTLRGSLDMASPVGKELRTKLDFGADQPLGQFRAAQLDLAQHHPELAITRLRRAAAWDPYSPPFRLQLAQVLTETGQTNAALAELQELCRLQPHSGEAQFQLGLALADRQEIEPAAAAFRQSTALDPGNPLAWYNLGLTESALSHVAASLQALDRAGALAPLDPAIPYERARTLLRAGRFAEARAGARRALELQPGFVPAQQLLQQLPLER